MYYLIDIEQTGYYASFTEKQLKENIASYLISNNIPSHRADLYGISIHQHLCPFTVTTDNLNVTGNDITLIDTEPNRYTRKQYIIIDHNGRHIDIRNIDITDTWFALKNNLITIPVKRYKYIRKRTKSHTTRQFRHIHYKNALTKLSDPDYKEYTKPIPQHLRSPWWDEFFYVNSSGWKGSTKARKQWAKHKKPWSETKESVRKKYERYINQCDADYLYDTDQHPEEPPSYKCHFCDYRYDGCGPSENCNNFTYGKCFNCAIEKAGNDESRICNYGLWPAGCINYKV